MRVEGAVNKPKELPYMEGMTVEDVISMAGGLSKVQMPRWLIMFRETNEGNFRSSVQVSHFGE